MTDREGVTGSGLEGQGARDDREIARPEAHVPVPPPAVPPAYTDILPLSSRTRLDAPSPWAGLPLGSRRGIRADAIRRAFMRRAASPQVPPRLGFRDAAVLLALFEEAGETRIILIERSGAVGKHRGEVAFPGGVREPGEVPRHAALREAREEIGLTPAGVEIIGQLDCRDAELTKFRIVPVVGVVGSRPQLRINRGEVRVAFDVSLAGLMADGVYREEQWSGPLGIFTVPFFDLPEGSAWGVTAVMLIELLDVVTGANQSW